MNKLICILFVLMVFCSCTSVKKYNEQINKPRTEKQLKSDVDFLQKKLVKLHPDLYWHISKSEFDRKFDSLRSSIRDPMTSNEFFLRVSPVAASVRQGHLQMLPLTMKYDVKQTHSFGKYGTNPLSKFEFEWLDSKLYIAKNYSAIQDIKPGTELVSVNNVSPQTILNKYNKIAASDGFNQTLFPRLKAKKISSFYFWEYGLSDSVSCVLNYKDTTRVICLKRMIKPQLIKSEVKIKPTNEEILARKKMAKIKSIQGIDPITGNLIRELSFPDKDSTVAMMKIRNFIGGNYQTFYRNSFSTIKKAHSGTLILDIRNNTGGVLNDVATLYSYLTDSSFVFIQPPLVTSRTSSWHSNYFRGAPLVAKPFLLVFSPFRMLFMGASYLNVKKDSCRNLHANLKVSKAWKPKLNHFNGDVYVLINGGTFSASCILSSNLKASKRAVFVGEETGGAFNGTVAGRMPVYKLPHSKLKLRFGLMTIKTRAHIEPDGYGIIPDEQIRSTAGDLLEQNDPELKWVLQNHNSNTKP